MTTERPDAMAFHANTMPRPTNMLSDSEDDYAARESSASAASHGLFDSGRISGEGSPMMMSPWNQSTMPAFASSSWSANDESTNQNTLIGSLIREEGHIYSLAASGDLLYTGSDSKNIRVWKNLQEFSGFKSNSGLIKTIIISDKKIFSGHQDGKIRVWKVSPRNPSVHKRAGTLPSLKDIFKSSIRPRNYVEVKKNRTALWIKHCDAVSCLCLTMDKTFLYSASWDRTIKVWRLSDSKCMESITAHDDAVNSVVCGQDGMVFSGSADGTVKAWRREQQGKGTKHVAAHTLLKQEFAVTSLAVDPTGSIVYGGSSDGIVNFWKREKQYGHGGEMKGHKLGVLCMASVGNLLFSGSADKTICVWRREGDIHMCLSVLTGHDGPVKCLAVMKDREAASKGDNDRWVVYSGSLDKSVKVWSVMGQSPATGQQLPDFDSIPSDVGSSFSSSTRPSNKR